MKLCIYGAGAIGGLLAARLAKAGTALVIELRGKPVPAEVTKLPFVPHRYHR